jgi:hypothetical protein
MHASVERIARSAATKAVVNYTFSFRRDVWFHQPRTLRLGSQAKQSTPPSYEGIAAWLPVPILVRNFELGR